MQLKLSKAKKLLSEVDKLMEFGFYDTVVNRLYYACFHATRALLMTKDLLPKTHSGVLSSLHQHFVQTVEFDHNRAAFFSRLMQERNEDDYNDFIILDEARVREFIEPAKEYVAYVEGLVSKYLRDSG